MFNVLDGALLKCVVTEVLFSIVGDSDISQSSVATHLTLKKIWKWVNI